ncbi:hypothetical protein LTS14_004878 [Recurvomyces mirabilis]|nr:hypothetical protein LTS14_004878 [Recurvomyces mirabilis]
MQPSVRQSELERLYQSRKTSRGHVPHISISDDSHHITEAIGSYYGDEQPPPPGGGPAKREVRPLSFMPSPNEVYESRGNKRGGGYFDVNKGTSGSKNPLERTRSNESGSGAVETGSLSPKSLRRMGSGAADDAGGGQHSPPSLTRHSSAETAVSQFPLNDIDYESSPAAVAQELSNLQAIRRMSMNVDAGDPDLAGFGGVVPTVAPSRNDDDDENDAARLFWVPARLHPELAPKEFKTFLEDRVDKIRRRSGDSDNLSVEGPERSASSSSSLRRKKSMLSRQIDTKGEYEDGADRLDRKRSMRMQVEGQATVTNLEDLEALVNDPQQLIRRMSMSAARRSSEDSNGEVPASEDMPILPPGGQTLKRSTRTTYRKGSLKRGERVPFSKRVQQRQSGLEDHDDARAQSPTQVAADDREPILGLTRVQTEPTPPAGNLEFHSAPTNHSSSSRRAPLVSSYSSEDLASEPLRQAQNQEARRAPPLSAPPPQEEEHDLRGPQARQFHSRLASGPGRTTAHLPGYTNNNPLPHIIETLPDGTKVPVGPLAQQQQFPERKSSHELPRQNHRGGAHMRPAPGASHSHHSRTSTLDDISSNPSPLPGSGSTRTDALTMVPTFEDKKVDRKDSTRKSSWKWILGNDDDEKEKEKKAAREENALGGGLSKTKSKLTKTPGDKARMDVLQNTIDGTTPSRGRESVVLNRADVQLDDERKKESKRSETKKEKDKESSLLSAIFGGKKKSSEGDLKDKKRKHDRAHSIEPVQRVLKPDIDYNWTRFSILEERAIYRMAHIKLANPRRALYSQVLLSNFMYSYLAKVQALHPQMQIPASQQQKAQQQQQQKDQPAEYSQYQRWQEQQQRQEQSSGGQQSGRTSEEMISAGATGAAGQQQQRSNYDQHYRSSYDNNDQQHSSGGYDHGRESDEYENSQYVRPNQYSHETAQERVNGIMGQPATNSGGQQSYSVASTHDYLGYPKDQQPFDARGGDLWDDDRKSEELW